MDKKYNPIKQEGVFEVSGFAGTKTIHASNERGAKYRYLKEIGQSLELEAYADQLTVKTIQPTEYKYG